MWLYASGADSLNGNIPDSVIPNIVLYDYHNSRAERAIKPFVIGRKNWLFSQTATGANASAMLYSIIETAKANDLNVFEYAMTCLDELSKPDVDIEQLLPWQFAKR